LKWTNFASDPEIFADMPSPREYSAIVYDQLCKEIGRVQLKLSENVAFLLWDGDQYNDISFDFKIINREINMTKYYLKDGKYLYKKLIDENKDFDD
jgi:hypothetical protein